ncbi:hypothetical protein QE152_g7089 [Popillia japonica]|uniref:Uncharacterized protein n=1 Tax=Popillia japonica TaxID=7064 RepID=A0AAW1MCN7_POPJA
MYQDKQHVVLTILHNILQEKGIYNGNVKKVLPSASRNCISSHPIPATAKTGHDLEITKSSHLAEVTKFI